MSNLSPHKRRAITALVTYGSVTTAADACGVSRQSLYRWCSEPEFAQALRDASDRTVEQASRRLTALVDDAITVLAELLESSNEHQKRLTADSILSHALRIRELVELEQRIAALEKRL